MTEPVAVAHALRPALIIMAGKTAPMKGSKTMRVRLMKDPYIWIVAASPPARDSKKIPAEGNICTENGQENANGAVFTLKLSSEVDYPHLQPYSPNSLMQFDTD
ncbi:MAG: hypothetical protein KTR23_11665 [Rhodospirillales bacterium]|nr:hypothetical protein [Rhodospirillales bacterium]